MIRKKQIITSGKGGRPLFFSVFFNASWPRIQKRTMKIYLLSKRSDFKILGCSNNRAQKPYIMLKDRQYLKNKPTKNPPPISNIYF